MLQQLAYAKQINLPSSGRSLLHLQDDDSEMRTYFAYGGILLILFILLLITLIQKRRQSKPLAANMLQFLKADEWELNESDVLIQFVHKIGNGSTAEVYRGKLSKDFRTPANGPVVLDESYQVAVKILKKNASETQKAEFSAEMEISKLIGRNNRIVNLIGK
uniref:Protein kinase domain-containing protein n=1 Tax=Panagrolaimus davidi TaxID=227884 RepID=A0A914PTU1_9BILA